MALDDGYDGVGGGGGKVDGEGAHVLRVEGRTGGVEVRTQIGAGGRSNHVEAAGHTKNPTAPLTSALPIANKPVILQSPMERSSEVSMCPAPNQHFHSVRWNGMGV